MILNLKKINFDTIKVPFLKKMEISKDGDIKSYWTRFHLVKKTINTLLVTCMMITPLHKMLSKMSAYVKSYDGQTKWMYFLIGDDDLLEKYNTIWDKVIAHIKKEFDRKPVYHKNFLKTKIKSYGDKVTDFYNKEIPNVDPNHTCLAVISLDSALKKDENYYLQLF